MTPLQLIAYYANLLILQYLQKPKAYATIQALIAPTIFPQTTVQSISFSGTAASGSFNLNWTPPGVNQTTVSTGLIAWNASTASIQTLLQGLAGLSSVTVTGSIAAGLVVTFTGVAPVAPLLVVTSNSLLTSAPAAITVTVAETDSTLPIALPNSFNLNGSSPAIGNQLTPLGKYAGVTRTVNLSSGQISLSDADFLSLIQFAILHNSAGSDLATIQRLIFQFFPNQVLVFDYANMQMSYMISSSVGSQNLAKALVVEGLLLRPMGVALGSVIYAPVITMFFGMRTYLLAVTNNEPFNNYTTYTLTWPWLSYANAIVT